MQNELYEDKADKLSSSDQSDIIHECQKHMGEWDGYFGQNLRTFRDDQSFYHGDQWPGWAVASMQQENIPQIVNNLIKPIVRILMGSIRELDPQITLSPLNSTKGDPQLLSTYLDILRAIAYGSHSGHAYATAAENMLTGGWGVVEIGTRYISPTSFNQEIVIKGIREPTNVFFDPNATETTKADSLFQGIKCSMSKSEFKEKYPEASYPDHGYMFGGLAENNHIGADEVSIVKYYKKDYKHKKLVALSNGEGFTTEVYSQDVKKTLEKYYRQQAMMGVTDLAVSPLVEVRKRDSWEETINCYELNGREVLRSYEWISKYMPYVFFDCNSGFRDGKQWTESFISNAKDAQRIYNFCWSQAMYAMETMRKERIFATPMQIRGVEKLYKYPQRAIGYMPYSPDPMAPGAPVVIPPAEISQTYFKGAEGAAYDIQRTLGVYEPSKGQLVSDASGVANMTAMMQSNVALKPVIEKMFIGMEQCGRICMDIIPKIYDSQREVQTQSESGDLSTVTINEHTGFNPQTHEPIYKNDLSKVEMQLQIKAGASFEAQKMVEDNKLFQILSLDPQFAAAGADLMAARVSTPAGYTLSKRLSAFVPPMAKAAEEGKEPPPPPPNPMEQAQLQTMQAQAQKLQAEAASKMEEVKLEQQKILQQQKEFELRQQEMMAKFYETIMKGNAEVNKVNTEAEIAHMEKAIDLHKFHSNHVHEVRMSEKAARKNSKATKGPK